MYQTSQSLTGVTLGKCVILDMIEVSIFHIFPHKEPTSSDYWLWKDATAVLCSRSTSLPYNLGKFLCFPHLPCRLFTTSSSKEIYYALDNNPAQPSYELCVLRHTRVSTRHGWKYDWYSNNLCLHPGTHFASITMLSQTCANMHSRTPFLAETVLPTSFLEVLKSFGSNSLWDALTVDGDGELIRKGIVAGTLIIMHDGSYMATESTDLCSAGVIMYFSNTKQWLKVSVAEQPHKRG
jgi:hypothetical protein